MFKVRKLAPLVSYFSFYNRVVSTVLKANAGHLYYAVEAGEAGENLV
ncbi:MAG: hypothetical protein KME32_14790 [Mojavia pulchra JT2-VF2]|jgi:hypothetical protein|uniref:Uncharacterized protein n=1 Tax=Mojavia pulchra JT2-VF2 TaxID=287848 RepID=A0A951PZH8_9NOST|nr:hypothetical protein [Mojavia pulchra JT2-VF2]